MSKTDTRPLLRGTLVLADWWPMSDRPGMERRHATLRVWCPHCREHHTHGWAPGDPLRPSHRQAHCSDPSPFQATGYYIAPWRKSDPEYAAHEVSPTKIIIRQKQRTTTLK